MSDEQETEVLLKCIDVATKLVGKKPRGYVPRAHIHDPGKHCETAAAARVPLRLVAHAP